jgi:hypothetical protein
MLRALTQSNLFFSFLFSCNQAYKIKAKTPTKERMPQDNPKQPTSSLYYLPLSRQNTGKKTVKKQ